MAEAKGAKPRPPRSHSPTEREEYDLMVLLERLESLVEEMAELGIASRAEAESRIAELHSRLEGEA